MNNVIDRGAHPTFLGGTDGHGLRSNHNIALPFSPYKVTSPKEFSNGSTLGFLLPLVIEQQLMGGMAGYFQLVKVASLLNLSIVEPYYQNTFLTGAPKVNHPALKLGSMYDLNHIRSIFKVQIPNLNVVNFEYFLERASRQVLFLTFYVSKDKPGDRKVVKNLCSDEHTAAMTRLNKWVYHVLQKNSTQVTPFNCSQAVIVDARPKHPLPLSEITEVLGSIIKSHAKKYSVVTVILKMWRFIHTRGDTKYFYVIPDWKDINMEDFYHVKHSETVINATLEFSQTMNRAQPVIGVHIRGERLLRRDTDFTHCLRELSNFLRDGYIANATDDKVHLFHDLGEYGTMSCRLNCSDIGSNIVTQIKQLGFPIVYYDPTKFKSYPTHRAFVALVEQEYLSRVDVLVAVGFGGFQKGIVETFLKYNGGNSENLHRICYKR